MPHRSLKVDQVGLRVDVIGLRHIPALDEGDRVLVGPQIGAGAPVAGGGRRDPGPVTGPEEDRVAAFPLVGRGGERQGESYAASTRATASRPIPGWSTSDTSAARAPESASESSPARSDEPMPSSHRGLSTSTHPASDA